MRSVIFRRFLLLSVVIPCGTWLFSLEEPGRPAIILTQVPKDTISSTKEAVVAETLRFTDYPRSRVVVVDSEGETELLSKGFISAMEPDISFDGTRVLFAAKRTLEDNWNIYEVSIDGTGLRQITREAGNCRSAVYQSTFYTIVSTEPWYQITFASDMAKEINEFGEGKAMSLYSCRLDGSEVRRLTYTPSADIDPYIMGNGRILFSSWRRSLPSFSVRGRLGLFTMNSDGTDLALFSSFEGLRVKQMACVTDEGLCVFIESDSIPWDGAGNLASVRLRRNLHSYEALTNSTDGLFHSPSPFPGGKVLVSRRSPAADDDHGIYLFDPAERSFTSWFDDPNYHDLHARVVGPRPEPDGRSSVVNEQDPTGQLYALNVSVSDFEDPTLLSRDVVSRLRVLEGIPRTETAPPVGPKTGVEVSPTLQKRLLGEVPLERDGSFLVQVPANLPIQLQLIDSDGLALRTCSWIWVKNREPRGCIGCHEDGELTPQNRLIDAAQKPATRLTLPEGARRIVDFRRDVIPIIESKCGVASCHGSAATPLSNVPPDNPEYASGIYDFLMGRPRFTKEGDTQGLLIHPGRARTSPLIWHVLGKKTTRTWDVVQANRVLPLLEPDTLTRSERKVLIEWIDFGTHWISPASGRREASSNSRGRSE